MALVLASKSPRRRELLKLVAPVFEVDEAAVDEAGIQAESPCLLAQTLAQTKAQDVFARRLGDIVLGCDTVVEVEGQTLGKPKDAKEAAAMMRNLSGKRHLVHTGVCLYGERFAPVVFCETTALDMAELEAAEIKAYVKTDEPYDKAGGYGIQGWAARYVTRIEGCYYNVMGLPVAKIFAKMKEMRLL